MRRSDAPGTRSRMSSLDKFKLVNKAEPLSKYAVETTIASLDVLIELAAPNGN